MSLLSQPELDAPVRPVIVGDGEMSEAIRGFPWETTPIGPIETWPETLLTTVNLILCSPHPSMILWGPGMVMLYNDAFIPMLTDRHPALGRLGREFWTDVWPVVGEQLESVLRDGKRFLFQKALVPLLWNGVLQDTYFDYTYTPIYNSSGEVCGLLDVCWNVTSVVIAERERSAAEEALRQRQKELDRTIRALHEERSRLFNVLQQAPIFFALLEAEDHVFTMANPAYATLVGGRDVLGKAISEALPEVVAQGYVDMLDSVYCSGEPVSMQGAPVQIVRTPGQPAELRYVDFTYQPLREPDNSISAIIVLGVDITEKKRSEQALLQNEKLAAVGRLASTIAHEINNPLESVTNLVYLARHVGPDHSAEFLDQADLELRRISAITHQTLSFNKRSALPSRVSSAQLFRGVVNMYQSRIRNAGISLEERHRAQLTVLALEGEIRQVLNNLVSNAIDAMPLGGRLLLRSVDARHPRTGEPGIRLTVADTGLGISPEALTRIFEPFYTTKDIGGTGLGLWISRDIVERHRGGLRVRSSVSPSHRGTVFTLFLPRNGPSSSQASAHA
jgi:signal transduction histidine kinase